VTGEQSTSGTEHHGGTPGAFAEEHIRIEDAPITVNYHGQERGGHGEYAAQCPICEEWYRWHDKDGAIGEAKHCRDSHQLVDTDTNQEEQ